MADYCSKDKASCDVSTRLTREGWVSSCRNGSLHVPFNCLFYRYGGINNPVVIK